MLKVVELIWQFRFKKLLGRGLAQLILKGLSWITADKAINLECYRLAVSCPNLSCHLGGSYICPDTHSCYWILQKASMSSTCNKIDTKSLQSNHGAFADCTKTKQYHIRLLERSNVTLWLLGVWILKLIRQSACSMTAFGYPETCPNIGLRNIKHLLNLAGKI